MTSRGLQMGEWRGRGRWDSWGNNYCWEAPERNRKQRPGPEDTVPEEEGT